MSVSDYLWTERKKAVMKIRAGVLNATRSWFEKKGFLEVQGPIIVPAIGDSSSHFHVKYFNETAHLSRGLQQYAEVFMANLGRIFSIAPVFRPDNIITNRHLAEYWHIEAEIPHNNLDDLVKIQEQLVCHICQYLYRELEEEFMHTNRSIERLGKTQAPFLCLSYDETIDLLQKDGFTIQWGAVLDLEHQMHLSSKANQPFFIQGFPLGVETFFYRSQSKKPEITQSMDLFAPEGYGEISTGGLPIVETEELMKKMKEEGVNHNGMEWYLSFKELNSIPYSGFAMGVERLVQWICGLENIKEAIAFPRSKDSRFCL